MYPLVEWAESVRRGGRLTPLARGIVTSHTPTAADRGHNLE